MGFYGNIKNTSRTQFQFDIIYDNRAQMDLNATSDGIYTGRYVLIEYDRNPALFQKKTWYYFDGQMYTGIKNTEYLSPDEETLIVPGSSQEVNTLALGEPNQRIFCLDARHSITSIGPSIIQYKKIVEDRYGNFTLVNLRDEAAYLEAKEAVSQTEDYYVIVENGGIVNRDSMGNPPEWVKEGTVCILEPGCQYEVTEELQYFQLSGQYDETYIDPTTQEATVRSRYQWTQLTLDNMPNYQKNFAIDQASYDITARGYDSTVWQKVFANGREKYVMIAELNSVVPTFGVSADPPRLVPTSPHFDITSTNIYYLMHLSTPWAMRMKAANPDLILPILKPDGKIWQNRNVLARDTAVDKRIYPSDMKTYWVEQFPKDTEDGYIGYGSDFQQLKYNPDTSEWIKTNDNPLFDAAIYYNKKGFDSEKISYGSDITDENQRLKPNSNFNSAIKDSGWKPENEINLSPTGQSGHIYNQHNGSIDLMPAVDTQEFSVMLPIIGDAIAELWDMVYGGRETTNEIASTNLRNKDIAWEDAKVKLSRRGLRLRNNGTGLDNTSLEYNSYNRAAVDTMAGCINTMHDLIGMIVTPAATTTLEDNINSLDENRIYYDSDKDEYFRKHLTYTYDPDIEYTFSRATEVLPETFDPDLYYVIDDQTGEYVPASGEYDPNETYYERNIDDGETFSELTGADELTLFDGDVYLYQDFNNSTYALNDQGEVLPKMCDYVSDSKYYPNKKYFTVDVENDLEQRVLSKDYVPNKYFYRNINTGDFILATEAAPVTGRVYYDITNAKKITDPSFGNFKSIYIPGYYYYEDAEHNYVIDYETRITQGRIYYIPMETAYYNTGEGAQQLYAKRTYYALADPQPTADYFPPHIYYKKENEFYTEMTEYLDSLAGQYYVKKTELILVTDNQVQINTGEPLSLTTFWTNTFYRQLTDEETGKVTGYKLVRNMSEIDGWSSSATNTEFWVFGSGGDGANPPFKSAVKDNENERFKAPYWVHKVDTFYTPHVYHYIYNNSIILDNYAKYSDDNAPYYTFINDPTPVTDINFYESFKYYTPVTDDNGDIIYKIDEDTGEPTDEPAGYTIVTDPELPEDVPLFKRENFYVYEDKNGLLDKGAEWNPNVTLIPPGVTLAKREEKYELQLLQGFARNLNTVNGLILKFNQLCEVDDRLTRDERNASGLMNKLKDIIAFFGKVVPRQLTIADDYGRITSSPWVTLQKDTIRTKNAADLNANKTDYGVKADVYPETNSLANMRKQWITLNVDGDVWNPKVTIHHNYQHVTDTTSSSDMNIASPFYIEAGSVNNANNSVPVGVSNLNQTIQLYTPKVDAMGHVVGENIETKTLPFGYRAFSLINETDHENDLVDSGSTVATTRTDGILIADNTQDLMTITAANKWIAFVANPTGDAFTIGHKLHSPNAAQTQALFSNKNADEADNVVSDNADDKLVLHDIVWDAAGHMLEDHEHTYTMPYGFKFITTGAASNAVTDLTHAAVTVRADNVQDTVTFKSANIWTKLSASDSDDSVTFGHLVRSITRTAQTASDLNVDIGDTVVNNTTTDDSTSIDAANQINIQDITHDEAGHIRSRQDHIYTLPYGFKFITTNGTAGATTANDSASNYTASVHSTDVTTSALNTQDTLTIDPGNGWLKVNVNQNDRKVTLYHYIAAIDKTASTATDFNNVSDGVFSLYDITHDDAGHITAWKSHQYTLPYNFKTITHSNSNAVTDLDLTSYTPANNDIVADTVVDTFNFVSQNKWIRFKADTSTDTLTISHLVNNFAPTTTSGSLSNNTSSTTTTFDVVDSFSKDEAGHLTAINTKTWTMPNVFGKFAIDNAQSSNNTTAITASNTTVEADCTCDTLTLANGDRWILLASDATNDKITIGHNIPDTTTIYECGDQTAAHSPLQYGDAFVIPHIEADKFGHIHAVEDISFTLPSISCTLNGNSGNVMTGISLTTTSGAFTYTQANVGSLALTGWTYNSESQGAGAIEATDTIIGAFCKLQKRIANEETNRANAIAALDVDNKSDILGAGKTLATLSETDGKITYTTQDISITTSQISNLSDLSVQNSLTPYDNNSTQVFFLTSLSESNGVISYTSEELSWSNHIEPILPTGDNAFLTVGDAATTYEPVADPDHPYITDETEFVFVEADPGNNIDEETKTIDELIAYIKVLEGRIETLEGYHTT